MSSRAIHGRVNAEIERQADSLVRFLQEYVQHKSVNPGRGTDVDPGEEESCQKWLAGRLRDMAVFDSVDVWEEALGRPNVAAIAKGTSDTPGIMFNGHTDTVEVTQAQREVWVGDPWSAEIRDGSLYGRGATDMKGGNVAFLWAAKVIRDLKLPLHSNIVLTFSVAEETSEADIGPLSVLRRGYTAPYVVNAEPTNLRISPATMGWFFFKISVQGKGLHPASRYASVYPSTRPLPLPGVDAVEKMRRIMDVLSALENDWSLYERHPLMPAGGMNLSPVLVQGGSLRASMPEQCEAVYAVVFNPSLRSEEVLRRIRAAVAGLGVTDRWLAEHPPQIEVPVIHQILEPVNLPPEHIAVRDLTSAYCNALGSDPDYGCLPGPCDANIMSEAGVDTVIFGPGDLAMNAHGANEYVPIQQVIDACKVYAALMINRCVTDGPEDAAKGEESPM